MEVMEDTPTPQFPVALCTTAPTIPTAQTGELDPRTTTRTEGSDHFNLEKQFVIPHNCALSVIFRPEYGHAPGIEDKWRHTYPYVPTSYYYNNPTMPRQNPESIGEYLEEVGFLFLQNKNLFSIF